MSIVRYKESISLFKIVVIAGTVLIFGILGYIFFRYEFYKSEVRASAEAFLSDLEYTRELSAQGGSAAPSHPAINRYGIAIVSTDSYVVYRDTNGNIFYEVAEDEIVKKVALIDRVTMLVPPGNTYSFSFPTPNGSPDLQFFENGTKKGLPFDIIFVSERIHYNRKVLINPDGGVLTDENVTKEFVP